MLLFAGDRAAGLRAFDQPFGFMALLGLMTLVGSGQNAIVDAADLTLC